MAIPGGQLRFQLRPQRLTYTPFTLRRPTDPEHSLPGRRRRHPTSSPACPEPRAGRCPCAHSPTEAPRACATARGNSLTPTTTSGAAGPPSHTQRYGHQLSQPPHIPLRPPTVPTAPQPTPSAIYGHQLCQPPHIPLPALRPPTVPNAPQPTTSAIYGHQLCQPPHIPHPALRPPTVPTATHPTPSAIYGHQLCQPPLIPHPALRPQTVPTAPHPTPSTTATNCANRHTSHTQRYGLKLCQPPHIPLTALRPPTVPTAPCEHAPAHRKASHGNTHSQLGCEGRGGSWSTGRYH